MRVDQSRGVGVGVFRVRKMVWTLLGCAALSACGVVYTPQKVYEPDSTFGEDNLSYQVDVVPMTRPSVVAANSKAFSPKQLPRAFGGAGAAESAARTVASAFAERGYEPVTARQAAKEVRASGLRPIPGATEKLPTAPRQVTPSAPPADRNGNYRIGVADLVLIASDAASASDFGSLSALVAAQGKRTGYVVQDDGAVALPDVGRVFLAGLSIAEARDQVFKALVEKNIDPSFSLEVVEFNSQRAAIGGLVSQPSLIPITLQPITVQEALAAAGLRVDGTAADTIVVQLLRDGRLYEAPAQALLTGQARLGGTVLKDRDAVFVDTIYDQAQAQRFFAQQLALRAEQKADIAFVQEQRRLNAADEREAFQTRLDLGAVERDLVFVTGAVSKPGIAQLPFEQSASLASVLFQNGGLDPIAGDPSDIYVLRTDPKSEAVTAFHLDAANALQLPLATEFEMRPNDVVFVETHPITDWSRVVNQVLPTLTTTLSAASVAAN